jgi:hypothetical protein
MYAYDTRTIELEARSFRVEMFNDDGMGKPWNEEDGHGPVSDWTRRNKKPGEIVLAVDRESRLFYDFAEAVRIARRDGWNCKPYIHPSKGAQAAAAALADFKRLRDWYDGQWGWCGMVVTMLDEDGEPTDITASLWGLCSDDDEHLDHAAYELAAECKAQAQASTYPVSEVGI